MAVLYIGGLDMMVDSSHIHDLFLNYNVLDVNMKFGYCFVAFLGESEARRALHQFNGILIGGKRIRVEWARSNYDQTGAHYHIRQSVSNSASSASNQIWPNQSSPSHQGWGGSSPSSPESQNSASAVSTASSHNSASVASPTSSHNNASLATSTSIQNRASSNLQPVTENTLLECEICFVRFDYNTHRPRSLPCGHSLCSLCITDTLRVTQEDRLSENPSLICPFCRNSAGPRKTRVGQFPENFFILKMLEVEDEKAKNGEISKEAIEAVEKNRKMEEEKKREKDRKKNEEALLEYQKQMSLDSSLSGIISCKDHLKSLEDLNKEQLSMKSLLKTQRENLLEEVGKLDSKIMELSEQMISMELFIASGKNLWQKLESLRDRVGKENKKGAIEAFYVVVESCCQATQIWSERSLPEMNKMNLFIKNTKESWSNGSMKHSVGDPSDLIDLHSEVNATDLRAPQITDDRYCKIS